MSESRTKNTIHNVYSGLIYQAIATLLSFFVRKVFLSYISVYFLGLDGLFSNLINMMTLLDFGVGSAATYYLSKAFANNDQNRVNVIYHAYTKLYRIIAVAVAVLGVLISIKLDFFVDIDPQYSMSYVRFVFYVTLARTVAFYLFTCPKVVFDCAQKNYVNMRINIFTSITFAIVKIIGIYVFRDFNIYLYILLAEVLTSYALTYRRFHKEYPFKKADHALVKEEQHNILDYGKHLVLLSINNFIFNSTDNLVISKFLGVTMVGLMSNYYMIVNAVTLVATQIISSSSASIYNYVNDDKVNNIDNLNRIMHQLTFICFAISLFCAVCLFGLTDQFIALFFGSEYVVSKMVICLFVMNLMVTEMMYPLVYYETGRGLQPKENIFAAIAAITNIVISVVLSYTSGIAGVLLGTLVSNIILFFGRFYIVYANLYLDYKTYLLKLVKYVLVFTVDAAFVYYILPGYSNTLLAWIGQGFVCAIVVFVSLLFFRKEEGFQRILSILKGYIENLK